MSSTHRLALPFIIPGQAQKEISHNESLQTLDVLVAGAVEEGPGAAPPASPVIGSCYIVADAAIGDWQGRDGQVAAYTIGGWRYIAPVEGMALHVRSSGETATFLNSGWELGVLRGSRVVVGSDQVVSGRAAAIADPAGGTKADPEARAAISAILAALRGHGLIAT